MCLELTDLIEIEAAEKFRQNLKTEEGELSRMKLDMVLGCMIHGKQVKAKNAPIKRADMFGEDFVQKYIMNKTEDARSRTREIDRMIFRCVKSFQRIPYPIG